MSLGPPLGTSEPSAVAANHARFYVADRIGRRSEAGRPGKNTRESPAVQTVYIRARWRGDGSV
jgi:hypothetical protein